MLKIILCDDDPFILKLSLENINIILRSNHLDAEVVCTAAGSEELFNFIKKNPGQYLVFLDLDFGAGRLNGIDVAKTLRSMDCVCRLVFVTNHDELAMKVLKSGIEPFGFLEKSTDITKLMAGYQRYICMLATRKKMEAESIGQIMSSGDFETDASGRNASRRQASVSAQGMLHDSGNEMTKDSGKVHVKAAADEKDSIPIIRLQVGFDEYVSIVIDDIIFVETEKAISHGITYHTVNGSTITIISTLEEELKRLGDGFIKPHRSYLVNKRHVLGMKDGCLTLSNQEEIPCAFRLRSEVKRWIQ